jgi:hypothetical protein
MVELNLIIILNQIVKIELIKLKYWFIYDSIKLNN